jgi:hypothetical protein
MERGTDKEGRRKRHQLRRKYARNEENVTEGKKKWNRAVLTFQVTMCSKTES